VEPVGVEVTADARAVQFRTRAEALTSYAALAPAASGTTGAAVAVVALEVYAGPVALTLILRAVVDALAVGAELALDALKVAVAAVGSVCLGVHADARTLFETAGAKATRLDTLLAALTCEAAGSAVALVYGQVNALTATFVLALGAVEAALAHDAKLTILAVVAALAAVVAVVVEVKAEACAILPALGALALALDTNLAAGAKVAAATAVAVAG